MAAVLAEQVYLVQGQYRSAAQEHAPDLNPTIEQCVVLATNDQDLYTCLAVSKPDFRPLGVATLADYENTAKKLRACVNSDDPAWEVILAPGMGSA